MSWTEDIDLVDRLADVLLRRRGYTLDARPGADFLARADGEQIDEARDDARAVLVAVGPHIAASALRDAAEAWAEDPDSVDSETPADTRNWMRDRADEIEQEARRD